MKATTDVPPDTSSLEFDLVGSVERIGMRGLHQTYIAHLYRFMQDVEVNDEVVRRAKLEVCCLVDDDDNYCVI